MNKKEARILALRKRDAIPLQERDRMGTEIAERLFAAPYYAEAEAVLSYVSFRSEVATGEIHRRILTDGKRLYLPKTYTDTHEIRFYQVAGASRLVAGYQGILEPEDTTYIWQGGVLTLLLMPGVAFDNRGVRVGYGGGYYDRFLDANREKIACSVMLGFEAQRMSLIMAEPGDQKPDEIVTEKNIVSSRMLL